MPTMAAPYGARVVLKMSTMRSAYADHPDVVDPLSGADLGRIDLEVGRAVLRSAGGEAIDADEASHRLVHAWAREKDASSWERNQ